jgi:uncharacterized protein (TIGR00251 family)
MWITEKKEGVVISCQIQPKSSRSEIVGLHGEPPRLKIKVAAPPVDGEANEELVAYLAKKLKVPKRRIQIISGHTGKYKDILILGWSKVDFQNAYCDFK